MTRNHVICMKWDRKVFDVTLSQSQIKNSINFLKEVFVLAPKNPICNFFIFSNCFKSLRSVCEKKVGYNRLYVWICVCLYDLHSLSLFYRYLHCTDLKKNHQVSDTLSWASRHQSIIIELFRLIILNNNGFP